MSFKGHNEYKLINTIKLDDLNAVGYQLEHKQTGARVALCDCDDDNKVFMIGFRTPPSDDTGVPHIMEHSVLCGSKNFPVKDPFVELAKGSLNTFLNAMTYPDKTVYPVASCNDKDFANLMHIYLDAVFYPNIYEHDEIFRQEGWSLSLADEKSKLEYNGVVYNEMKGAFSSPDGVLEREILNSLFPGTCYAKESGGHPDHIPELTYEDFIAFHKKYYHPSNSYIYLYGDMDFEEKLDFINENYLKNFTRQDVDSEISAGEIPVDLIEVDKDYPVAAQDNERATYYAYNKVITDGLDKRTILALRILDYALISSPGAPLEEALIKADIADDISGYVDTDVKTPYLSIVAKNGPEGKKDEFVKVITDTFQKAVDEGIDKKALLAGITSEEFIIREGDFGRFPKGLMYGLMNMSSWLYDDDSPFLYSELLDDYKWLKDQIDTGYFEGLIKKYVLDNKWGSLVSIHPAMGLETKRNKELSDKLESIKQSMDHEEILKTVADTKALRQYQEEPSSPEDMAKIPVLSREDIDRKEKEIGYHETNGDINYIDHDIDTNGIDHIRLYFPIDHIKHEDWMYLSVLTDIFGMVNTKNYAYNEMASMVNLKTGGVSFSLNTYKDISGHVRSFFCASAKALSENTKSIVEILSEILYHSDISDAKRIDEILAQISAKLQSNIMNSGHVAAMKRGLSHFEPLFAFKECTDGIEYYRSINSIRKELADDPEKFKTRLKSIMKAVFGADPDIIYDTDTEKDTLSVRKGIYFSVASDKERTEYVKSLVKPISEQFESVQEDRFDDYTLGSLKEAFKTSSKVQYVSRTGTFDNKMDSYTGAFNVLRTMLSYEYLWNNIRVLGGAYGCMNNFTVTGEAYLMTYRDPHLKRSNDVFEKLPEYLENLEISDKDLTKYVIGTMSSFDAKDTPGTKILNDDIFCFTRMTTELRQKIRNEILDVTCQDLRNLAGQVQKVLDTESFVVIGSEDKIEQYADMFDEIITLS